MPVMEPAQPLQQLVPCCHQPSACLDGILPIGPTAGEREKLGRLAAMQLRDQNALPDRRALLAGPRPAARLF